ncbi:HEPN domain-containing protein [Longimicrobium sp.]|uniref:HEPN domain-containing protein n=1 Tax=Longimicrobium sp. TaxID=2029185 RepID=UPI002F932D94
MPVVIRLVADRVGLTGDTHVRTVRIMVRHIVHLGGRARRMIPRLELRRLAFARLKDARALYASGRYDAARYLCGYAVELALKARICRTLRWEAFPQTRKQFEHYGSFKIHNLQVLLRLSGMEERIRTRHHGDWVQVSDWDPTFRYAAEGTTQADVAKSILTSARQIVRAL